MKKYKINRGFIFQKLGKDTVIFDSDNSVLYTLNETASYIFRLLKKGFLEEEIARYLTKKYRIKEKRAFQDTAEFLREMVEKKIVLKENQ